MLEKKKMQEWCDKNARNPKVLAWIEKNPPPKGWKGSPLEWAYTEMPNWVGW